MKLSLNSHKRPISIFLMGVFFAQGSVRAEWTAANGAVGPDYQPVLSSEQAEEKENTSQKISSHPLTGGFSTLSLTKADEDTEESPQILSSEEKDHVLSLLKEISALPLPVSEVHSPGTIAYDQGNSQEVQESVKPPSANSISGDSESSPSLTQPPFKAYLPDENQHNRFQMPSGREPEPTENLPSASTAIDSAESENSIQPYQKGPSLFDFEEIHVSNLPEAVRQTGVELTIKDGNPPVKTAADSEEITERPRGPYRAASPASPTTRMLEWVITLLDNFEMSLGPQEIEKQLSSETVQEAVMAAPSGPSVTRGQLFPHPWMASILGATAEVLRLSAEQLRDWLQEAEAFDQGSLRLKISSLRKAVSYLLANSNRNPRRPETLPQGYRLVNSVDVDQELAALHVLANPPRMHPFVRHVLFETQTVPGMLKRYWLDVEKLKELYAKAGTTDEQGNIYLIRYKGQILKNPYRPMPDDMGGRYELVIAE